MGEEGRRSGGWSSTQVPDRLEGALMTADKFESFASQPPA